MARRFKEGRGYVVTWHDASTDGGAWKSWKEALNTEPCINDTSGIYIGRTASKEVVFAALVGKTGHRKLSNLTYIPESIVRSVREIEFKPKRKRK